MIKPVRAKVLFFAYGSNLDEEQFLSRCLRPEKLGVARLADHRIGFYGYSEKWDGGEETAVPAPGQDLFGIVYRVAVSDFDRLDYFQGVRLDGRGAYFHYPANVIGTDGATFSVLLYKKDILGPATPPSAPYLALLAAGAAAQGLPPDWIAMLAAHPSRPASYPVPCFRDIEPGVACAC
jgi:hypothetical protein